MKSNLALVVLAALLLLTACSPRNLPAPPTPTPIPDPVVPDDDPENPPGVDGEIIDTYEVNDVSFSISAQDVGLYLQSGGDVDWENATAGNPAQRAFRSGNGQALPSTDGNTVPDYYLQFDVDDSFLYAGIPTQRVVIDVEYLDVGSDNFNIQYDAAAGEFTDTRMHFKTNTGEIKTASFALCDAYFANRDNGADFRISDMGDGAETIVGVTVNRLKSPEGAVVANVDDFGANPFDDQPDSEAIQTGINEMCPGDTIVFTSPGENPDYQGYLIDKTIFLTMTGPKSDLTFTSSNEDEHALLQATADLKGFVVMLSARSMVHDRAKIDDVIFHHLDVDSNRQERICFGEDQIENGLDDNWGSWLPECTESNDAWCRPGGIAMVGAIDFQDPYQNWQSSPNRWSTGLKVEDVTISNVECGTGLAFEGADGTINNVTIDTAGEHVHNLSCAFSDRDEPYGAWSDGMTVTGPNLTITNNLVINPTDIGIVHFGGKETTISHNTIIAEAGNYGAFGGIALHPWTYGISSNYEITHNTVTNLADEVCGGIHAGINIGGQMWGMGCTFGQGGTIGNSDSCSAAPDLPGENFCGNADYCQVWGYVPKGTSFTLAENTVTGAHINYLINGMQFDGELILAHNYSNSPKQTDWQGADGCYVGDIYRTWGPMDYVAFNETVEGWTELEVYCER